MKVELNSQERLIILDALIHDPYVKKILEPDTPKEIAIIYDALVDKMSVKEIEATAGKPVHAIEMLRKEINFINFKLPEMNEKEKQAATDAMVDLHRSKAYLEDL